MKDWYTVPHLYGGRTFPLHRRMFIEFLWRRHGQEGLDWYIDRMQSRMLESLKNMERVWQKVAVETTWASVQMDRLTEVMREAGMGRTS